MIETNFLRLNQLTMQTVVQEWLDRRWTSREEKPPKVEQVDYNEIDNTFEILVKGAPYTPPIS
jgi:hypothetical protein